MTLRNLTNQEVITGSDFRRMITGAYSEFLLEYESINEQADRDNPSLVTKPGTNILRTMGAAVMPLEDAQDDTIGGLARRVASAAALGARGSSGVVLSQLFRGIAKGLIGKIDATSSEFGKAFQYGILYAQRVLPEDVDRPIVSAARAVAKGAYKAVRANLPIYEILAAAIEAGSHRDDAPFVVGERIMMDFLKGCQKGLTGNFVSPVLSFSVGTGDQKLGIPDPRQDEVHPYCMTFGIENSKGDSRRLEEYLQGDASFIVATRHRSRLEVHLHTAHPGLVLEKCIGFGRLESIRINNMAEPHAMILAHHSLMPVALLAAAYDEAHAERLQKQGVNLITLGGEDNTPSVGALVNAAHSDLAESYVMVSDGTRLNLELRQVKRILGDRVEIITVDNPEEQEIAVRAFNRHMSAKENAARMTESLEEYRGRDGNC
ncbi:DAK2 domain-containing protein [Schwartzia succinivorans]|uniref:DhaL domain-containing protein n=1 Tax=Schwartzia succinivorans DSM 10502 TaxID=1123243 RepID=A0A1M4YHH3_9FIRM|nr:DAK2 domain-containing protein [Schwartzia succinivorans]SHF05245.1 hypothetical protein SAMN02745190_01756 [Schwartzia succinivorans DSM 10502]